MAALALIAAWQVRERRVRLFVAITGVCLLLALGAAPGGLTTDREVFPPLAFVPLPSQVRHAAGVSRAIAGGVCGFCLPRGGA